MHVDLQQEARYGTGTGVRAVLDPISMNPTETVRKKNRIGASYAFVVLNWLVFGPAERREDPLGEGLDSDNSVF